MPIYVFSCENKHSMEVFKHKPYKKEVRKRCNKCGMYMRRDIQAEHSKRGPDVHLSYDNDPISHLTRKRSFKGIWVENLTPEPVFVKNKDQYHKLLKTTHSLEKAR